MAKHCPAPFSITIHPSIQLAVSQSLGQSVADFQKIRVKTLIHSLILEHSVCLAIPNQLTSQVKSIQAKVLAWVTGVWALALATHHSSFMYKILDFCFVRLIRMVGSSLSVVTFKKFQGTVGGILKKFNLIQCLLVYGKNKLCRHLNMGYSRNMHFKYCSQGKIIFNPSFK